MLLNTFFTTFPPKHARKKYKLCNFAPKTEMVEKPSYGLIYSKKE